MKTTFYYVDELLDLFFWKVLQDPAPYVTETLSPYQKDYTSGQTALLRFSVPKGPDSSS